MTTQHSISAGKARDAAVVTSTDAPARPYATGLTRENIERTLTAAGRDPGQLAPADLAPLEDFHRLAGSRPCS